MKRHIFFPVVIETAGSWSQQQTIELMQEMGGTQRCHHLEQYRNQLSVSESVRDSVEGKCGLILRHFPA